VNSSFNNGEVGFIANSYTGKKTKNLSTKYLKSYLKALESNQEQAETGVALILERRKLVNSAFI